MHFFSQYRGLRRENYVLFFGRIVTNMGSMVWPMLTMILNQKLGMSAGNIAILTAVFGILMMPATLFGGKLADRLNKKNIIIVGDIVSVVCYILCGAVPLGYGDDRAHVCRSLSRPLRVRRTTPSLPISRPSKSVIRHTRSSTGARISVLSFRRRSAACCSKTICGSRSSSAALPSAARRSSSGFSCGISRRSNRSAAARSISARETGRAFLRSSAQNPTILLYLAVSALCSAAYDQYGYLMPLDLGRIHGENGAGDLRYLVSSLNCIVVVLFTPFITRLFRRVIDTKKLLTGKLLFLAGYVLFLTFLGTIPMYYAAMLIFTWGEIINTIADGRISPRAPRPPTADASTAYPAWRIPSCAVFQHCRRQGI